MEGFNNLSGGGFGEENRKKCLENGDGVGNTVLISAGTSSLKNSRKWERRTDFGLLSASIATTGNYEIVSMLIGAGCDVNAVNSKGATAL